MIYNVHVVVLENDFVCVCVFFRSNNNSIKARASHRQVVRTVCQRTGQGQRRQGTAMYNTQYIRRRLPIIIPCMI
jgi:hypothetical protein